jgi:hypothetical protein
VIVLPTGQAVDEETVRRVCRIIKNAIAARKGRRGKALEEKAENLKC